MFDFVDIPSILFKYITQMTAVSGYSVESVISSTCTRTAFFFFLICNNFLYDMRKSCLLFMSQFIESNSTQSISGEK